MELYPEFIWPQKENPMEVLDLIIFEKLIIYSFILYIWDKAIFYFCYISLLTLKWIWDTNL